MTTISEYTPKPASFAVVPPGTCQLEETPKALELLSKQQISPDTYIFTFATPDRKKALNLPTCACILTKYLDEKGEKVVRPYTPCSTNATIGSFELMVKVYPDGKMTQHLVNMKIGDTLEFFFIKFNIKLQYPFNKKFIGMIVGGTGITPMIQALHAILGNKKDQTEVCILYGSRSSENILAKQLLDAWEKEYPQLSVTHVLSHEKEGSDWSGERGYISSDLMKKAFPDASGDMQIFVCGPPPMYKAFCGPRNEKEVTGLLKELGYAEDHVYKY